MKSRRGRNLFVGSTSLLAGGLLYICFRERTYFARLVSWMDAVADLQTACRSVRSDFLRYYLPDFLWGVSLGSFLQAINLPKKWGVLICGVVVLLLGSSWELMQLLGVASGTADILDVLMYLAAGAVTVFINCKERRL